MQIKKQTRLFVNQRFKLSRFNWLDARIVFNVERRNQSHKNSRELADSWRTSWLPPLFLQEEEQSDIHDNLLLFSESASDLGTQWPDADFTGSLSREYWICSHIVSCVLNIADHYRDSLNRQRARAAKPPLSLQGTEQSDIHDNLLLFSEVLQTSELSDQMLTSQAV
jgi:hypothetical protein